MSSGVCTGLERALSLSPEEVVAPVTESKLAGRGGGGFPTGVKWKAVAEAPGDPKYIVCCTPSNPGLCAETERRG